MINTAMDWTRQAHALTAINYTTEKDGDKHNSWQRLIPNGVNVVLDY